MLRSDFRGATGVSRAGLVGQPSRLLAWLHDEIGLLYLGGFGPVAEDEVDRSSPRCNIPNYEIRFSRDGIDSRLVVQYYRCRTELILLLAPSRVYFSFLCSSSGQRQANRHQPCHLPIWGEELGCSSLRLVVEGAGYEIMGHFHFRSVALTLRLDPILGMR